MADSGGSEKKTAAKTACWRKRKKRERCWYVKEWLFVGRKESERNGEKRREGKCQ